MDQYDNPIVSLEVNHPPDSEAQKNPMDEYFLDPFTCDPSLLGPDFPPPIDPSLLDPDFLPLYEGTTSLLPEESVEDEDEKEEEEKRKLLKPLEPRGALLQPSWYGVYYDLKKDNPERALKYLERLMDFGILGIEPPRDTEEDRLIYNLLDGPMNVLNKAYASFCRERYARRKKAEEERIRKLTAEIDKRNKQERRRYRYGQ